MHLQRAIRGPGRNEGEPNPFVMLRDHNLARRPACWKLQHLNDYPESPCFPHVAFGSPIGGRNVRG